MVCMDILIYMHYCSWSASSNERDSEFGIEGLRLFIWYDALKCFAHHWCVTCFLSKHLIQCMCPGWEFHCLKPKYWWYVGERGSIISPNQLIFFQKNPKISVTNYPFSTSVVEVVVSLNLFWLHTTLSPVFSLKESIIDVCSCHFVRYSSSL